MTYFSKLLGLATIGGVVRTSWLLKQLMSDFVTVIVLAIISSILLAALIVGGFIALYECLIISGLDSGTALMVTEGILAGLTILFFAVTLLQIKHLKDGFYIAAKTKAPFVSEIGSLILAFLDGFNGRRK